MSTERTVTLCGRELNRPGHICAFFDSREEQYDVLVPYYKEGIGQGEQVITIVDGADHGSHCRQLKVRGLEADKAIDDGSLKVFTSEETYTSGGRFGADRMYRLLQTALADAASSNRRVRTSGVMDWSSRGHAGTEELMDYESRVNVLVPTYDCTLLCVYDLDKIDGRMVMDILRTHPYVVNRRRVQENPYYVPPIEALREVLGDKAAAARLRELQ